MPYLVASCHVPDAIRAGRLLAGSLTLGLLPAAAASNGGNGNNGRACPAALQMTYLVRRRTAGGRPSGHVREGGGTTWELAG